MNIVKARTEEHGSVTLPSKNDARSPRLSYTDSCTRRDGVRRKPWKRLERNVLRQLRRYESHAVHGLDRTPRCSTWNNQLSQYGAS